MARECGQSETKLRGMKRTLLLMFFSIWFSAAASWADPTPLITPESQPTEPHQSVTDLFGGGIALYRMLPESRLQVVDFEKNLSHEFHVNPNEVQNLQEAYLLAQKQAATITEGAENEGVQVRLRTHEVFFVPINKDGRRWVVLNVLNLGENSYRTFMAVPQGWLENDPQASHLAKIRSNFESLLVKAGL